MVFTEVGITNSGIYSESVYRKCSLRHFSQVLQYSCWCWFPVTVFYLLFWSPSHLECSLQVTWPLFIFTPSDLEAKSFGEILSDFGCWLEDILGRSNIVICILYLLKFLYVIHILNIYSLNICTWGSQCSLLFINYGPFSISYFESSNLASHLASYSPPTNLCSFLSLIS